MHKYLVYLLIILSVAVTACSKSLETVENVTVDVLVAVENNSELFNMTFNGAINNKNESIAFTNVKGELLIKDDKSLLAVVPFEIDAILPLNVEKNVIATLKYKESEAMPLLNFLNISRDSAMKGQKKVEIPAKNISLKIINYNKVNILELLEKKVSEKRNDTQQKSEGKIHEKNK